MKLNGRRGNPGLVGKLLEKSIEAYILSLETINRLSIKYRIETFCYLICNAWELLLKARLRDDSPNASIIFYKKKRNKPRRSISLRDAVKKVMQNENDPVRRNIEEIADLRDESVHLIIADIPQDIMGLFQASVINYHNKLKEWFSLSLSDKVTPGMMTIVYDIDPAKLDLGNAQMRSSLPKDTYEYLQSYVQRLADESKKLGNPSEFRIGIDYRVFLTKNPTNADISLSVGESGDPVKGIVIPKDPGQTHPYSYNDVYVEVNKRLEIEVMGVYDMRCIVKVYSIRNNSEFFYKVNFKNSPGQYSNALVDWIVEQYTQNDQFFTRCRKKYQELRP